MKKSLFTAIAAISLLFLFAESVSAQRYRFRPDDNRYDDQDQDQEMEEYQAPDDRYEYRPYRPNQYQDPYYQPGARGPRRNYALYRPFHFEITAGENTAEGEFGYTWGSRQGALLGGIAVGGMYNDDYFQFLYAQATMGNEFLPGLQFQAGFKGLGGTVEEDNADGSGRTIEGDLGSVGFLFSLTYNFRTSASSAAPFQVYGSVCVAPSPMCFSDVDEFWEWKTGFGVHILGEERGTVLLGYRYIKAGLEEEEDWDISDDGFFLGLRFRF